MAEPVLGELDEAPPLLTGSSGEESEAEAHGGSRSNYSGGPPHLTSESSGGEGDDLLGQPRATSLNADFLLGGTAAAAAAVAQQARLQPGQRRPLGSLDEVDQSDYGYTDEGDGDEEEWEPLYGGPGLAGVGGPAFAGGASLQSALLGGGQLAELGELELDEGLLQQVPIQELLEAVLQGVGGGPLGGLLGAAGDGGRGRAWGFGAHGSRIFDALAVDASQLPAGLEGSARRHALLLAEQGFVTALDPARHAACAAEGIPGGRQQGTPPHRRAHGEARAAPAAASRAGLQRADSAAGGGGLQRGDSAAGGGGLQRGDSAASQGLNPLARQQRAASGQQPGAPLSRLSSASLGAEGGSTNNRRAAPALAGLAEGEAAGEAAGAVAGSDDNFDMPPLVSEESSSVSVNGSLSRMQAALQSGSSGSSSDDEPGSRSRRRSSGTASERQLHQAPPPRGRQRRNAIFGQLPGLGAGTSQAAMGRPALPDTPDEEQAAGSLPAGAAPVDVQRGQRGGAPAADSDGDLPPLLDDLSDGSSAGRDSIRGAGRSRAAAARAACPRRLAGSSSSSSSTHSGNGPPALESRSESEGSVESSHGDAGEGMPHQRASGGNSSSNDRGSGRRQLPLRQSGVSAGGNSAVGVGMLPRPVANEGGSEPPGLASEEGDSESEGGPPGHRASGVSHPPDLTSDGSYSSSLDDLLSPLRTHAGRQAARRFTLRRAPAHQQQAGHPAQGGQGFTADQRDVMQALTSLLPPQQDGVGWAELAAHVRSHRASAQRGGSGGGVQLLSRLVAAAASQFPGEAEAAGLTERPLAPLPTSATASPVGASAGASSAVSRAASAAPDGRAAEAEAWIHLQQHVQGAQSPVPPPPQQQQQQRPPTSLGVGGEGAGADLRQQLEGAVQADLQAQLDSGAAQRAQHAQQQSAGLQQRLPQPADGAGSSISAAAAAGAAAAEPAEGGPAQPPRPFASGTQPEAAAGQPGAAALAALTASMPGAGSPQGSVASTVASAEAALRLLSLPEAAAAQHPLPPLVAAALAAARAPPPDQPEE